MTNTVHDQFVGAADESTYGTSVAPTDFFEIVSESINPNYERIESAAIRGPILRDDRFAPNPKGAAGDFTFDVLDKGGLKFWLNHMLGGYTLTGDGSTTPYEVTAVPASLSGKSFTLQVARYASVADALIPFVYKGGKVTQWELSAEVDGIVQCKVTCDFAAETISGTGADALATPIYPTDAQMMTFIGGDIQIGGVALPVKQVSVTGDNGLKVDRYTMRAANSTLKREPKEASMKEFGFSLTAEFESDTQSQQVAALTAAGVSATLSLAFDSPQGGTLTITAPAARLDTAPTNAQRDIGEQTITGKMLAPAAGGDAISIDWLGVL